jgi:signal transduction histidine kinase
VLVAGAGGLFLFRTLVRRLEAMEHLARRVARGDLDARVEDSRGDEIGRLGAQLNVMTESLRAARNRLSESDRQRRQLLADISHELATPLTSIRGSAETILSPTIRLSDAERGACLRNVLEESERMDLLIKDLLDLSRLESGSMDLRRERLDWTALCRNTMIRFQSRFDEAGLTLAWAGRADAAWVEADGRRMEQVLDNLMVNAIRYVPAGGHVTLSISDLSLDGKAGYRLTVSDDGPGIPEPDLPHVFDRFYRADPSRTTPGSGLGLAIVREIVALHGGSVGASSRQPHGIVIRVDLPAASAAI